MMRIARERRKYPRHAVDLVLDLYERGRVVSRDRGWMTNISLGGAAVESLADYQRGTVIVLDLAGPNGKLVLEGRVTHAGKGDRLHTYGLEFFRLGIWRRFKVGRFIRATIRRAAIRH